MGETLSTHGELRSCTVSSKNMDRKDHVIGLNVSGILLKLMVLAFGI